MSPSPGQHWATVRRPVTTSPSQRPSSNPFVGSCHSEPRKHGKAAEPQGTLGLGHGGRLRWAFGRHPPARSQTQQDLESHPRCLVCQEGHPSCPCVATDRVQKGPEVLIPVRPLARAERRCSQPRAAQSRRLGTPGRSGPREGCDQQCAGGRACSGQRSVRHVWAQDPRVWRLGGRTEMSFPAQHPRSGASSLTPSGGSAPASERWKCGDTSRGPER